MSLEKEAAKLIAFLKEQPRLSDSAEQEGLQGKDNQDDSHIYNGEPVKDMENEKAHVQASPEVESLLSRISSDCPYNDWFRVGCVLKHEGCAYEVFRDWSAKAPKRFDEDACRRTWDSIGEDHDAKVSMGTLRWMAGQSCSPEQERLDESAEKNILPVPESVVKTFETSETSPLPEPETTDEMAEQALEFISSLFRSGEHFELVVKRGCKDGRYFPFRCRENICQFDSEGKSEFLSQLKEIIEVLSPRLGKTPPGAWISLNPVCEADKLAGNAASDKDVTDFRYALVEADDLSREEQWRKLSGLNLPILCVTWSGGKSLHAIVKVEAGTDYKLYKDRIAKLYDYLGKHHFPADGANKNPSRLTRIPGFYRDGGKQYLFARESGPKSWHEFEAKILPGAASSSPAESDSGKQDSFLDSLIKEFDQPLYPDAQGKPSIINQNFFAGYTVRKCGLVRDYTDWRQYQPETGLWKTIPDAELLKLVSQQLLAYSRQYDVPWLAAKRTNKTCKDIKAFIAAEQAEQSKFTKPCRNVIHVRNGMLRIRPDGTVSFEKFSPDYYSKNRSEIDYKPGAKCPMFLEKLLVRCMKPDDIECIQLYVGQCLLGINLSQTFLMLTGTAGAGKSTLVNVIEAIVNRENCTELRLDLMADRFELYRLLDKTLLTAKDVKSNFLTSKGAYVLKALVGGDTKTAEAKGRNETFDIEGTFNAIITANTTLTVDIDADNSAWDRRMRWIEYNCEPVKKSDKNPELKDVLLKEEGSGILNWAIEGACKLITNGGQIPRSEEQTKRIKALLLESDSVRSFIEEMVIADPMRQVTSE